MLLCQASATRKRLYDERQHRGICYKGQVRTKRVFLRRCIASWRHFCVNRQTSRKLNLKSVKFRQKHLLGLRQQCITAWKVLTIPRKLANILNQRLKRLRLEAGLRRWKHELQLKRVAERLGELRRKQMIQHWHSRTIQSQEHKRATLIIHRERVKFSPESSFYITAHNI